MLIDRNNMKTLNNTEDNAEDFIIKIVDDEAAIFTLCQLLPSSIIHAVLPYKISFTI